MNTGVSRVEYGIQVRYRVRHRVYGVRSKGRSIAVVVFPSPDLAIGGKGRKDPKSSKRWYWAGGPIRSAEEPAKPTPSDPAPFLDFLRLF
jgi:hypothetical protein